ncbi:MAG: carboxypeptidase regulatory-like domain-containing protein [Burkholderiaceae bacterium]|nr:carboxypeptidase regulatory-like domain-containing protein [Burkholderiaceae bacterium]
MTLALVSGQVTLDGIPLPDARIIFRPEYGRMSQDMTDPDGRYELAYTIERKGALLGNHRVAISTAEQISPSRSLPERVPDKYNKGFTLVAVVARGQNVIDFHLEGDAEGSVGEGPTDSEKKQVPKPSDDIEILESRRSEP